MDWRSATSLIPDHQVQANKAITTQRLTLDSWGVCAIPNTLIGLTIAVLWCLTNSGLFGRKRRYLKFESQRPPGQHHRVALKCLHYGDPQQAARFVRPGIRNAMRPSLNVRDVKSLGGHPAPRSASDLLAKGSRSMISGPSNTNLTLLPTLSISGGSTLFTHSIPLKARSDLNKVDPNSNLVVPRTAHLALLAGSRSTTSSYDSLTYDSTPRELAIPEDNNDDDPEGIRVILCTTPRMDRNVKQNTLPFVLYRYSRWAIASVFEPLKVMHKMKDQVIAQFSSEKTRTRSILIANVMSMFVNHLKIDGPRKSILNHLVRDVQKSGAAFMATPPSFVPALDRQSAIRILDNMLEIVGLQLETHPISDCLQLLENAAPIFRRACPDPPGKRINLPNLFFDLSLNLRHFATMDIILSVITGLPTCVQYEVPFSFELCDRVYHWQLQGNYGLQWLYGLPDQYIMIFAWINTLSETPGAGVNTKLITWIESQLPQIKVAIDESGDPSLRVGRMVVLESWQFTVPIYLYMVLCKASADDTRVIRAQKGFMRLLRSVKPARNPDGFLMISMTVVGVATLEERDRETLRQRILGVQSFAERGTAGNNAMLMLEDIWARTRDEGRAAVWSDLRAAFLRVTGG
ncbi:hypothetical protein OPQ81_009154 [Rhizoctonia solani]|nr:hypothetical protein OPQ81_009154 [Rhizoctonia solani]